MNEGHKKITGSSCGDCIHESVCCHRKDFLDICKAVAEAQVKKYEDGKAYMKQVTTYDILDEIVIKCKHYHTGASVQFRSDGSITLTNLCDISTSTGTGRPRPNLETTADYIFE